jgi:charged multivesicular body protein 6
VLDLKIQRDKLHQYSKRIQTVLSREKELAKEALVRGEKQKALLILRRRKYQEQVLLKADQQLETLEHLVHLTRGRVLTTDSID